MYKKWIANDLTHVVMLANLTLGLAVSNFYVLGMALTWFFVKLLKFAKEYEYWQQKSRNIAM